MTQETSTHRLANNDNADNNTCIELRRNVFGDGSHIFYILNVKSKARNSQPLTFVPLIFILFYLLKMKGVVYEIIVF